MKQTMTTKRESLFQYIMKRLRGVFLPRVNIVPPSHNLIIEKDVSVVVRDGTKLSINIYRPNDDLPHPVIICFHPYDKNLLPKKGLFGYHPTIAYRILRQPGLVKMSALTTWESPDPAFWVENGYVVINGDVRGFGKSEGSKSLISDQEAEDYYDLIEWAALQPWSNGNVGLNGVSYLAISQYKVAALSPPHLKAICPWEGFSDLYEDFARPGGIREDGFLKLWSRMVKIDFRDQQYHRLVKDEWYKSLTADLTKITVPTLVCGSFSDHCLHTRGSYRVFNQINSKHKWLYTHRFGKWAAYYSEEALAFQLKFFDYFLHNKENDLLSVPPVRLEVRETRENISEVSYHPSWPIPTATWQHLYLNGQDLTLRQDKLAHKTSASFETQSGCSSFEWEIPQKLKIVGPMKLQVYVEVEGCEDVNFFVGVRKYKDGEHIPFEGSYGFGLDIVSKGWLKASLRKVDRGASEPWEPKHTFDVQDPLKPKEIVRLEIGLLPSATLFQKGDVLRLDIQGHPFFKQNILLSQPGTYETSLPGRCIIHSGKTHNSHLLVPIVYV